MKEKNNSFLIINQRVYIFLLFLLFFPVKTQLQNFLFYLFDMLFTNGITTDIYVYNFRGRLLGCQQLANVRKLEEGFNFLQKHGLIYVNFIPSLIAFSILLKRWKQLKPFTLIDWTLTLISCFSILNAFEFSSIILFNFQRLPTFKLIRFSIISIPFLLMGTFIFLKIFSIKERLQTIIIGLPSIFLSSFLWFRIIGPQVLPVIV